MTKENYFVKRKSCCCLLILCTTFNAFCQPNQQPMPEGASSTPQPESTITTGPPPPPDSPIDGFLFPLFIAGILLVGYKYHKGKNVIGK